MEKENNTSILSSPTGPNELLTIFATAIQAVAIDEEKNDKITVLCSYITSSCSYAIKGKRHGFIELYRRNV